MSPHNQPTNKPKKNLLSTNLKSQEVRTAFQHSLKRLLNTNSQQEAQRLLPQELRRLSKISQHSITKEQLISVYRQDAGKNGLPPLSDDNLRRLRLKPMRSQSGIQTVAVLTKPFPCPGQCIFCPNDVRMPKSYIASEPGAQRAERNSFDPYLQTYSRLQALQNMGHHPSKIELIVLGGTWSYYPESYQIWFIHECFRALNDFGSGLDDRERINQQIKQTVQSAHRQKNIVTNSDQIKIRGDNLKKNYNQIISQYYLQPEIELEGSINVRRETKTWEQLKKQHQQNEFAAVRCVGLTLETRPDNISAQEVIRLRRLGCTKTQIGFQSLSNRVLKLNKRGHDTKATKKAVYLLRQAGFKIHAHWMPNLYGSSLKKDHLEYKKIFLDKNYKPDELKIYPCALIPSAELMAYYQRGQWKPYTSEELHQLLAFCLTNTPPWARLTRVVRDIPSQETATNHLATNLRQLVEDKLKQHPEMKQFDIRAREIKNNKVKAPVELHTLCYRTSTGQEHFLQLVDQNYRLLAFLRLSLPTSKSFIPELSQHAIIRELHVYGQVAQWGSNSKTQHRGYGSRLIESACHVAAQNGYDQISVISAVGTRGYYRQQGFVDGQLYQHRSTKSISPAKP